MSVKENKAIVRRWVEEVLNGRDLEVADELLSAEVKTGRGGREELKNVVVHVNEAFPDFHQSIDALVAEGDTVIELWTNRATHTGGEYAGLPPTGKRLEGTGVNVFRVLDGKIVEQWGTFDHLALLEQLGFTLVPPEQGMEK